jgi:restriction system protein
MILKFYEYFHHVLEFSKQHGKATTSEIRENVLKNTGATVEERNLVTNKGTFVVNGRLHWAIQYLFQAGALTRPAKGVYEITQIGLELLEKNPNGFTQTALEETEGYRNWFERVKAKSKLEVTKPISSDGEAPQESLDETLSILEDNLSRELVSQIQNMSPIFLEKTVLKLLRAMGYGFDEDSLKHTGGPGDEGIDGFINQDKLGVQKIFVQAKRYKSGSSIGRETLQSFVGAIEGAVGGVFITTSTFTKEALEYAHKHRTSKIELIDGPKLGRLMQEYEIGVIVRKNYKVMDIDENFFYEE